MLRPLLLALTSLPLLACSAFVQRAVTTTEAATEMQQVTRSRTNELDPAISPDGKTIVYEVADSLDATPHLEAMDVTDAVSGRPGRVQYSSRSEMGLEPAWMPDGSRLVFVSDALGFHKLVETIGPSVRETRFLGNVGDPSVVAAWPAVSPDGTVAMTLGKMDLFESGWRSSSPSRLGPRPVRSRRLWDQGPGRGDRSRLEPRWIANRLLAHGRQSRPSVRHERRRHRRHADHGRSRRRRPPLLVPRRKRARLLLRARRGRAAGWTQANLFSVRPDGSWLLQLTEGDRVACRPDWARDGYIYFHANATDRYHIWRIGLRQAYRGPDARAHPRDEVPRAPRAVSLPGAALAAVAAASARLPRLRHRAPGSSPFA